MTSTCLLFNFDYYQLKQAFGHIILSYASKKSKHFGISSNVLKIEIGIRDYLLQNEGSDEEIKVVMWVTTFKKCHETGENNNFA